MKKTTEVRRWVLGYEFNDSGRAMKDTESGLSRQGFEGLEEKGDSINLLITKLFVKQPRLHRVC